MDKNGLKVENPIADDSQLQALELLRSIATHFHRAIEEYVAGRIESKSGVRDIVEREGTRVAANRNPFVDAARGVDQVDSEGVRQIVYELFAAKEADGLSKRYIETVRSHLVRFSTSFTNPIRSITASQMESWLRAQPNRTAGPK